MSDGRHTMPPTQANSEFDKVAGQNTGHQLNVGFREAMNNILQHKYTPTSAWDTLMRKNNLLFIENSNLAVLRVFLFARVGSPSSR